MNDTYRRDGAKGEIDNARSLLNAPAPLDPVQRWAQYQRIAAMLYRAGDLLMIGQPLGCCATTGLLLPLCTCGNPQPWVIWVRPRKA